MPALEFVNHQAAPTIMARSQLGGAPYSVCGHVHCRHWAVLLGNCERVPISPGKQYTSYAWPIESGRCGSGRVGGPVAH